MVRRANPNDRIVSMMVNWKMAFKEVAKTRARATKNVCHRTMLSQNQKRCLHKATSRSGSRRGGRNLPANKAKLDCTYCVFHIAQNRGQLEPHYAAIYD